MILIVMGFLTVILVVFSNVSYICPTYPIVNLPGQGKIKGSLTKTTWTHQQVQQFLGIPYAESPSGSRRFKVSFSLAFWEGGMFIGSAHTLWGLVISPIYFIVLLNERNDRVLYDEGGSLFTWRVICVLLIS